jgi:chorismate mutase / prephenate dehydratase
VSSLGPLRKKVDRLDQKILSLLNQRAQQSKAIGQLKKGKRQGYYVPDRERQVLDRLSKLNRGPLTRQSLEAIYREIMSSSLRLEKDLNIAYLGPQLTFTHQASVKKFGKSVHYVPCDSIPDVFLEVEHERCDYGVVPVENSTEGAIDHTLDSFIDSQLKVCSEIILKINLTLLSRENSLKKVKRVYSNPQVFGQCRQWLESNLSFAQLHSASSTAKAAQIALKEKGAACIASKLASEKNNLHALTSSIQDRSDNVTRFLVLSRESARPTRHDKTSLMLSVKDRPGALYRILDPFRKQKINLTKIESRPSRRQNWEYYFFIDFEAHVQEARVQRALSRLESECRFMKVLGSYPKAD